jgi:hypothetical protein
MARTGSKVGPGFVDQAVAAATSWVSTADGRTPLGVPDVQVVQERVGFGGADVLVLLEVERSVESFHGAPPDSGRAAREVVRERPGAAANAVGAAVPGRVETR